MLTVLTFLGVLAALFFAAALATREQEQLQPAPPDAADVVLPSGRVTAEQVAAVRFGLAPRGYRMSEVDAVLSRLGEELAQRDAELAQLRGEPAAVEPVVESPVPAPVEVAADAGSSRVSDGAAPDLSTGEAPREPVDPPAREDSTLPR